LSIHSLLKFALSSRPSRSGQVLPSDTYSDSVVLPPTAIIVRYEAKSAGGSGPGSPREFVVTTICGSTRGKPLLVITLRELTGRTIVSPRILSPNGL
jgi:hypothetical protein